jgi:hypothetical protein
MQIECLTTFKEGKETFHKDDVRTVSDEDGARFVANGWAKDRAGRVAGSPAESSGEASLDIKSSVIGMGDSNG